MNIYLIRHARQNSTLCNVNVPLSENGIKQAVLLGKRLSSYPIDGLYSSDLIRAVETTKILYDQIQRESIEKKKLQHEIREELREIDFGHLTGKPDEAVKEFYQEYNKRENVFVDDLQYPGGECGKDVYTRVYPIIQEIAQSGKKNVAVISHGGAIRALLAGLFAGDVSKRLLFALSLENCSITQLYYDEEKNRFYLERFNDYAHLEVDNTLLRRNW